MSSLTGKIEVPRLLLCSEMERPITAVFGDVNWPNKYQYKVSQDLLVLHFPVSFASQGQRLLS